MHAVVRNWREARLAQPDRALCEFAVKLTRTPEAMSPRDLEILRTHGFDDTGIHDATQVVGYFNYITRVADALGVEPEKFIEPWGAHGPAAR